MILYIFLGLLLILFIVLIYTNRVREAFENSWEGRYAGWRTEYLRRFHAICPIQQKLNEKLQRAGDTALDVKAGGKLPACGVEPAIPEKPELDQVLIFFADFPDESEQVLMRSAKLIHGLVTEQYQKVQDSLNATAPSKVEAFFAGAAPAICGADSIKTREQLKEASMCKNPSELPEAEKLQLIQNILQKHLVELDSTADFDRLVKEATEKIGEMEKVAKQAENGTLPIPQVA